MPERHVGVGSCVDADGMRRVMYVEQQAEARARSAGEADRRIHGNVVALIGAGRRARGTATAPATRGVLRRCLAAGCHLTLALSLRRRPFRLILLVAFLAARRDRQSVEDSR